MSDQVELTPTELDRYSWQLSVRDFGVAGQQRLKNATVLISRAGGVGGSIAWQLAAAGVGRLILAHAGNLRLNDLNRQLLMSTEGVGRPRVETAVETLQRFNPLVTVEIVAENIDESNVADLVARCDVVAAAAPLFSERLLLNREAVRQGKPLVDGSMFELEGRVMAVQPGETACLACLYPESPPHWKREFPVFSAVSSAVGSIAAMEILKIVAGFGTPLWGRLLLADFETMSFQTLPLLRRPTCEVCGHLPDV